MIPFWQKAVLVALLTFTAIGTIFIIWGGTITCDQLHNTTDCQRICGNSLPTIPQYLFTIFIIVLIGTVIYGAILLRKRLRELGEVLAKQGSMEIRDKQGSKYPDSGESGEAYDADADRNKDPR
jgi:hypothetical protein